MFTEARLVDSLEHLQTILSFGYAQFLAEDQTGEYRVLAQRVPPGETGYAIAHRTGVIGQVFRRQRAIVVPDTRSHPLYDPYDATVDWEVAIPLFRGERLAGVLNLEGRGEVQLDPKVWRCLAQWVAEASDCSISVEPPDVRDNGIVRTERISCPNDGELLATSRRLASGGRWVLAVSDSFARMQGPKVVDIEAGRVPLAEAVHSVETGVDAVALQVAAFERLGGWRLADGRYDFVLVKE